MSDGGFWYSVHPSDSDRVRLGDRTVPRALIFELGSTPMDREPSYFLRLEVVADRPQCREIRIKSADSSDPPNGLVPGEPFYGRDIRQRDIDLVRLNDWIEDAFAFSARQYGSDGDHHPLAAFAGFMDARRIVRDARRGGQGARRITREFLEQVAAVYRRNIDDRPTQAVADAFGIKHSTAAEYVRRARAVDPPLLPPTTPGKRRA